MAEGKLHRGKTLEQIYQKKSQLEHILLRPDTYVGSIEQQTEKLWVLDEGSQKLVQREINYVPGLYKIFDEILVNAADNFQRDPANMTYIKVNIEAAEGWISVENNGQTLPVEVHKEHKMYVPEMVFGHLLTSGNYDDEEQKVTGGRNGYGAKLTNIFSTTFTVECADGKRGHKYVQKWSSNMGSKAKPSITKFSGKDYTKVTFYPDLAKFGMAQLDSDIVALMKKRVFDVAGTTNKKCKVFLNNEVLAVKDFKEYVDLYFEAGDDKEDKPRIFERASERWEFAVGISDGQFQQVSFVNSINTTKGGTHVSHVADQFVEAIHKRVKSKNKGGMDIKFHHVRSYLAIFVNCLIVNPSFDSQTKETMTLKASKFGSKCEVSDSTINKVLKTGIVDMVLQWARTKEAVDMQRKMKATGRVSRLVGVPKLEDANWAGTKNSEECTLILTEGDSAKSLAVAGLGVVGRDRFGVFPLRGKPLNVRDATFQQTMNNQEIQNIIKIMGLDQKREYDSVKSLRYGSLMIMADQDYDGSHIKGLIINMVQHWWPSLFKMPGFLKEFVTPIVKATKGDQEVQFFTLHDYNKWQEQPRSGSWSIKYYKGLGTSTAREGKEYFRNIANHELSFKWNGGPDDESIDLAFNKKRADDRKEWINRYEEGQTVDHSKATVSYADFVNKELVCFSRYDTMRSIPCVVDGFKPTQRKVLFCAFKRRLHSDVKVAQLAGYVAEHSSYHHGEVSLQGTIVGMAQDFVGSNNINLLFPSGQFGTRLQGGKDAASARYIYTRLTRIARTIFHPDDDPLLEYQNEEGQSIEPRWYIPVIPMVLVNGAEGIGTGWATSLPNYNPRDLVAALRSALAGKRIPSLTPWYKGFKGTITANEDSDKSSFEVAGIAEKTSPTKIDVTELPVKRWTQDYKEFLTKLAEDEHHAKLEDIKEYHTENSVHFTLFANRDQMKSLEQEGLEKALKLRSSLPVSNIVFFDPEGKIKKYADVAEILSEFVELRLKYYQKRKDYHLGRLRREKEVLDAKVRFILMVVNNELVVSNRKKAELLEELVRRGFKPFPKTTATVAPGGQQGGAEGTSSEVQVPSKRGRDGEQIRAGGPAPAAGAAAGGAVQPAGGKADFDYLLGMPIWSLTLERVEELKRQAKEKDAELNALNRASIQELWVRDLDAVVAELDAIDEAEEGGRAEGGAKRGRGKGGRSRPKDEEEEEEEVDEEEEMEVAAVKKRKTASTPASAKETTAELLARLREKQQRRATGLAGGA